MPVERSDRADSGGPTRPMSWNMLNTNTLTVVSGSTRSSTGSPRSSSFSKYSMRTPLTPGWPGGDWKAEAIGCAPRKMPSPDAIGSVPGAERTSTPSGARSAMPRRIPTESAGIVTKLEPPTRAGRSVSAPMTAIECTAPSGGTPPSLRSSVIAASSISRAMVACSA